MLKHDYAWQVRKVRSVPFVLCVCVLCHSILSHTPISKRIRTIALNRSVIFHRHYVELSIRIHGLQFKPFFRPGFRISYSMRFGVFPVFLGKICSSTTSIACTSSLVLLAVFGFDRNSLRFCGFLVLFVQFCGFLCTPLPPPCRWTITSFIGSFCSSSNSFCFHCSYPFPWDWKRYVAAKGLCIPKF